MKIRIGFVSNSSSANFLIATKRPLTYSMLRKKLLDHFKRKRNMNRNTVEEAISSIFHGINHDAIMEVDDPSQFFFYDIVKNKDFVYFYPGGIADYYEIFFGIEIDDEDFNLIIADGY